MGRGHAPGAGRRTRARRAARGRGRGGAGAIGRRRRPRRRARRRCGRAAAAGRAALAGARPAAPGPAARAAARPHCQRPPGGSALAPTAGGAGLEPGHLRRAGLARPALGQRPHRAGGAAAMAAAPPGPCRAGRAQKPGHTHCRRLCRALGGPDARTLCPAGRRRAAPVRRRLGCGHCPVAAAARAGGELPLRLGEHLSGCQPGTRHRQPAVCAADAVWPGAVFAAGHCRHAELCRRRRGRRPLGVDVCRAAGPGGGAAAPVAGGLGRLAAGKAGAAMHAGYRGPRLRRAAPGAAGRPAHRPAVHPPHPARGAARPAGAARRAWRHG